MSKVYEYQCDDVYDEVYKELYEQKVKALETTDADLLRLQGIMLYLNQKLENERAKNKMK